MTTDTTLCTSADQKGWFSLPLSSSQGLIKPSLSALPPAPSASVACNGTSTKPATSLARLDPAACRPASEWKSLAGAASSAIDPWKLQVSLPTTAVDTSTLWSKVGAHCTAPSVCRDSNSGGRLADWSPCCDSNSAAANWSLLRPRGPAAVMCLQQADPSELSYTIA